jgi:ADP-heptose:LPS heptosyltransferase
MSAEPAAVLVLHTGALGDSVLTWGILCDLRRLTPRARLTLAGNPERADLATLIRDERGPLADEAVSIDSTRFTPLFGDDRSGDGALREWFGRFDRVVSMLGPADCPFHRRLRDVFAGELWTLDTRAEPGRREHIVAQWRRQLPELPESSAAERDRPFTLAATTMFPSPLAGEAKTVSENVGAPVPPPRAALLHPGSGGRHKLWPMERFVETADRLAALGFTPVFVVGEAERERGIAPPVRFPVLAELSLRQLAELLLRAAIYVGNDSGPTHLAAALGTPTAAVFTATDPTVWSPVGPRVRVVGEGIPSSPPNPAGACPTGPAAVPRLPETAQVMEAIRALVGVGFPG